MLDGLIKDVSTNFNKFKPVIESVPNNVGIYGDFNAKTPHEDDDLFNKALANTLIQIGLDETPIGEGGQFIVYKLREYHGVVVKRLRAAENMAHQGNMTPEEYFDKLKKGYELSVSVLGERFVPNSKFLIIDANFGTYNATHYIESKEYVIVQEELTGIDVESILNGEVSVPILDKQIRNELILFVEQLRRANKKLISPLEGAQFTIDTENNRVKAYDVYFSSTFADAISDNTFLNSIGIDPSTLTSPDKLYDILLNNIPQLNKYKGVPYRQVKRELNDLVLRDIRKQYEKTTGEDVAWDLDNLVGIVLDVYPLEGDCSLVQQIIEKFSLDEIKIY